MSRGLLLPLLAALLAACGKAPPPAPAAPAARATVAAATTPAGLAQARCPAKVDSALSGPDIVGLKIGMTAADALNAVRCRQPDAVLVFQDRWIQQLNSYGLRLGHQSLEARSGDHEACGVKSFSDGLRCGEGGRVWKFVGESVFVATPGVPGRETVQGIWRVQRFRDGELPPADAVLKALIDKYGAPQQQQRDAAGNAYLYWVRDPQGQPLAPARVAACAGVQARGDAAQRWSEGCGVTVAAQLQAPRDNPALAREVHVGLLNQQQLIDYGRRLQDELVALDKARRAQELDKAAQAAGGVKL